MGNIMQKGGSGVMPYDNWMFCLIAATLLVFVGDVLALIYAGMFYYLALAKFNENHP